MPGLLTVVAAREEGSLRRLEMKINTGPTCSLCGDGVQSSQVLEFPGASFIHF